jgi:S-adenosyl methyltransferase
VNERDETSDPGAAPARPVEPVEIAGDVAHPARVYDYVRGGKDNFAADRDTADQMAAGVAGGLDRVRAAAEANEAFRARAVRYLVAEAGVRQLLQIGTAVPVSDNTHEVAQRLAPESRVVYVGNDPIVLANARVLLKSDPEGATAYVDGDVSDPEGILAQVPATLDLAQPIAILFVGILNHVADDDHPYARVAQLVDAVSPGSHLVVSHVTGEVMTEEVASAVKLLNAQPGFVLVPRTRDEVSRFFTGLELVEPGLVLIDRWRPDDDMPVAPEEWPAPFYGAIGRKP